MVWRKNVKKREGRNHRIIWIGRDLQKEGSLPGFAALQGTGPCAYLSSAGAERSSWHQPRQTGNGKRSSLSSLLSMLAPPRETLRTDQALGQYADSTSPLPVRSEFVDEKEVFPLFHLFLHVGAVCVVRWVLSRTTHPKICDSLRAATAEAMHCLLEVEVVGKGEISWLEDAGIILLSQVSPIKCLRGWEETQWCCGAFHRGRKHLAIPSSTARQLPAFIGSCLYYRHAKL